MITKLLDGVSANIDGDWFNINNLGKGETPQSLHIISVGAMTATVSLEVSNEEIPTAENAVEIMSETVVGMKDLAKEYEWYRARVTGYTAGTISVNVRS